MDSDIKKPFLRLWKEARKDFPFFGSCGLLVGLISVWQSRVREIGISENPDWANHLLSDFISINAFGLIFFVYLALGCVNTIASRVGISGAFFGRVIFHAERRLAQFGSAMICFMIGLQVFVALVSIVNLDSGGVALLAISMLLSGFIISAYVAGSLVVQRVEPFNHPVAATLILVLTLAVLGWLIFFSGGNISQPV